MALATHKFASVCLGIGASVRHFQNKTLNPSLMFFILCTGIPGVFIGSNIVLLIPDKYAYIALGILTFSVGFYSANNRSLGSYTNGRNFYKKNFLIGGIGLFLIGILNGSLSSGTGLIVTIWLVGYFKLSYSEAIGYTLIIVGLFWNGLGALVLGLISEIRWNWIPALLLGSLIGGYIGAHLSINQDKQIVKRAFETISVLMGISLVIRGLM